MSMNSRFFGIPAFIGAFVVVALFGEKKQQQPFSDMGQFFFSFEIYEWHVSETLV